MHHVVVVVLLSLIAFVLSVAVLLRTGSVPGRGGAVGVVHHVRAVAQTHGLLLSAASLVSGRTVCQVGRKVGDTGRKAAVVRIVT